MNLLHAQRLRSVGGVVMFTPLPPLANGIADYAAELLPALARQLPVLVVIDDLAPAPIVPEGCTAMRLSEYLAAEQVLGERPHLYQLGNNPDHVYLLPVLFRRPGVVVLHDVSLHHLVDQATLRWGDETAYADWLELEYGHAGRLLGRQFSERRWRPRSMFFELPMTREILTRSRAVIAHSLFAATKAQAQALETPVRLVRHHLAPSALQARRQLDRAACRAELGVAASATLLVSLGFVTRAKQIETVLRYMAACRQERPGLRYVIAGQDQPEHFDVRSLVASLGLQDVVHITGYVDEPAFYRWIVASDVVVNLRYPSGGETSGTLIRALGVGACVLVNDIGPFAEYPDEVCAKVPMDDLARHAARFAETLDPLLDHPAARRRYGECAAVYMADSHRLEDSAAAYVELLARHGERPVPAQPASTDIMLATAGAIDRRWRQMPASRRPDLPLWLTSGEVPEGRTAVDAAARVLVVGVPPAEVALLCTVFGYPEELIDAAADHRQLATALALPLRRRSVIFAVVHLSSAELGQALMPLLHALNGLLRLDARLLMVLDLGPEGAVAQSADVVRQGLVRHGFRCDTATSGRQQVVPALDGIGLAVEPNEAAPVQWLLVARKVSEFMPRRPRSEVVA